MSRLISNPDQMPRVLDKAIRIAVAQRGVSVVVIPGDVALQTTSAKAASWLAPKPPVVRPSDAELDALAALLNDGQKITLMCGAGCAGAHDAVIELARTLNAPIVHSLRGKEYVEYDNPFDVGMTGLIGFASGYAAMKECDTLLLLGTDFPYRQFYPGARQGGAGRHPGREPGQPLPARHRRGGRCRRHDRGPAAAAEAQDGPRLPRRRPRALSQGARRSRQAGREQARAAARSIRNMSPGW